MSEALSAVCDGHAPHPAEGVFGFSALADFAICIMSDGRLPRCAGILKFIEMMLIKE